MCIVGPQRLEFFLAMSIKSSEQQQSRAAAESEGKYYLGMNLPTYLVPASARYLARSSVMIEKEHKSFQTTIVFYCFLFVGLSSYILDSILICRYQECLRGT